MLKNFAFSILGALVVATVFMFQPSPDASANTPRVQVFSETHNFGSLVDAAGETGAITAPGAALGDSCVASVGVDIVDMTLTCYVNAANSVEYRLQNESGSTADLASTTVRVFLIPQQY